MPRCPTCGDFDNATYTRWLEIGFAIIGPVGCIFGLWLGRKESKLPPQTSWVQVAVEGGPQCAAHIYYGQKDIAFRSECSKELK